MDYHHNEITLNPAITLTIPITKTPPNAWDNRNLNHFLDNTKHLFSQVFLNFSTLKSQTNVIEYTPEVRPHPKHSPTNALSTIKPVNNNQKQPITTAKPPKSLNNYTLNNTINRHPTKNLIANSQRRNVQEPHFQPKPEPKLVSKDYFQKAPLQKQAKEEDFVDYDKMCVL